MHSYFIYGLHCSAPGRGLNPKLSALESQIYHYTTKLIFSISFPFFIDLAMDFDEIG